MAFSLAPMALALAIALPGGAAPGSPDRAVTRMIVAGSLTLGISTLARIALARVSREHPSAGACFRSCGAGSMVRASMIPIPLQLVGVGVLAAGLGERARGRHGDTRKHWRGLLVAGSVLAAFGYGVAIGTHVLVDRRCKADCAALHGIVDLPAMTLGTAGVLVAAQAIGTALDERDQRRMSPQLSVGPRGVQVGLTWRF